MGGPEGAGAVTWGGPPGDSRPVSAFFNLAAANWAARPPPPPPPGGGGGGGGPGGGGGGAPAEEAAGGGGGGGDCSGPWESISFSLFVDDEGGDGGGTISGDGDLRVFSRVSLLRTEVG